jgi:hypothetical protein
MTKAQLRELFAKVTGTIGDEDQDTDDGTLTMETVTSTLRQASPTVYQKVFDVGHSERDKRAKKELEKVTGELETAKSELEKARGAGATGTDDEKATRIRELEGQVQKLTAEKGDLEKAHRGALAEAKRDARLEGLRAILVGREGDRLEPEYAEVLLQNKALRDRVRINDDGTVDVLSASGVPYAPGEGQDAMTVLAGELVEQAKKDKPRLVISGAEGGSGTGGNGGRATGTGGATGDAQLYTGIRKEVEERQKQAPPTAGSAAQRMGMVQVGQQ